MSAEDARKLEWLGQRRNQSKALIIREMLDKAYRTERLAMIEDANRGLS
jgi:hypothetical protein